MVTTAPETLSDGSTIVRAHPTCFDPRRNRIAVRDGWALAEETPEIVGGVIHGFPQLFSGDTSLFMTL